MAKKSKYNLTVTNPKTGDQHTYEQGVIYPDSAVPEYVEESDFVEVSDDLLDTDESTGEVVATKPAKGKKGTKKVNEI